MRWPTAIALGLAVVLAVSVFFSVKPDALKPSGRVVESEVAGKAAAQHARPPASSEAADRSHSSEQLWTAKYRGTNDYLDFVRDALPAALKGDGRAAWYISDALATCALVVKTYRGSEDSEAQLQQELAGMQKAPQWSRDALAQKTRRCLGLARESPFAGLPEVEGGYTSSFWQKRALMSDEPLAQAQAAANAMSQATLGANISPATKSDQLRTAESSVRSVVESGDLDAIYSVAMLLANPEYSNSSLDALAVALATCDLGRDCSADNPENSFYNCKLSGACPANADYAYFVQQSLGPDTYAKVYAESLQVRQAIEHGDVTTVLRHLSINR